MRAFIKSASYLVVKNDIEWIIVRWCSVSSEIKFGKHPVPMHKINF